MTTNEDFVLFGYEGEYNGLIFKCKYNDNFLKIRN